MSTEEDRGNMNIVAGIDLGTQSLKAVLYDYEQKRIVAQASCPLDLILRSAAWLCPS